MRTWDRTTNPVHSIFNSYGGNPWKNTSVSENEHTNTKIEIKFLTLLKSAKQELKTFIMYKKTPEIKYYFF